MKRKEIKGYEGKYTISDTGIVYSLIKNKTMKTQNLGGYKRVRFFDGKSFLIHRLVYCTFYDISINFMGQKTKTLVLHKNDNRGDNNIENLFLGTQKDNMIDMISKNRKSHNKIPPQKRKGKITYDISNAIRDDYKKTHSIYKTGKKFNISYATVSRIKNNKIWA